MDNCRPEASKKTNISGLMKGQLKQLLLLYNNNKIKTSLEVITVYPYFVILPLLRLVLSILPIPFRNWGDKLSSCQKNYVELC